MDFRERLKNESTLILDGAMGTMLFALGLETGGAPELWNLDHPDRIQEVHQHYIESGSQVILTNTFGGTHYRLKLHNLQDRVYEINKAAAEIGERAAVQAQHEVTVAGDIGPTGELLEPMGDMTFADAKAAFAEQTKGLVDGGVNVLWIETMSDLDEVKAAIEGIREVSDLPITATLSFDTNGRTMMGVKGQEAIKTLKEYDLAAIGANCGNNLPDTMAAIAEMHKVDPSMPLIVKANAGIPYWGNDGREIYDGTPEVMAGYAHHVHLMGAQLIGACCGSDPDTIRAMQAALNGQTPTEQLLMPVSKAKKGAADKPSLDKSRKPRPRRRVSSSE